MSNVSKFNKWKFIKEARKPRKCPIIDFTPIRESELYSDLISLGWVEVNAQGHPRIEPAMELGKTDLTYQVQYQGEKQGNLRFKHPAFPMIVRMNLNGAIWQDAPSGRAYRIDCEWDHDPKWSQSCLSIEDYKNRLEYLIKMLLHIEGFISQKELGNTEGGVEIIQRKLDEDPQNVKKLRTIPPSLKNDNDFLQISADYGLI